MFIVGDVSTSNFVGFPLITLYVLHVTVVKMTTKH